jgi:hypothetical protein
MLACLHSSAYTAYHSQRGNLHFTIPFSTSFCVVTRCVQPSETVVLNVAPCPSTIAFRSAVGESEIVSLVVVTVDQEVRRTAYLACSPGTSRLRR